MVSTMPFAVVQISGNYNLFLYFVLFPLQI